MNDTQAIHPDAAKLSEFGLGRLDEAESRGVEAHLEACPACRTLAEAGADDSLVLLLRTSVQPRPELPATEAVTLGPDPGVAACSGTAPSAPASEEVPAELVDHPRYRVLEVLGSGGMGTVYRARHLLMEREVALKVINRALVDRPATVERFRREVKTAARLAHPHIVTAHDADQAGDWHFLVMEFVPGVSLARQVAERGPLPVAEACAYARQAALGLQHAFEQGMVHRDIKPQNLMLTPAGQVKILDFGLSRLGDEPAAGPGEGGADEGLLTQTGSVMGTPDYIAPEQATDAHSADIRADVYSLGCTLYHLLSGQPPFPDGTSFDKVLAHRERSPRPLPEVRPEVPAKLAAVVARMMARSPAQRYQTPAEVAEALAPFAAAPVRRRWAWAVAALLLLTAGIAAVAVFRPRAVRDEGSLVVEAPDKDTSVVVRQGERQVAILDLRHEQSCRLAAGDYDLALVGGTDHLYLPEEHCRVAPHGTTTIRVRKMGLVRSFVGHKQLPTGQGLVCVAFTPDGRRALSGGYDGTLRLWDVATGRQLRVFECPGFAVWGVAVSPDGRHTAWTGTDMKIHLSDLESGKTVRVFKGHTSHVFSVAFSPDGKQILSAAADGTLRLWEVGTGRERAAFPLGGGAWSAAFSPDGRYALAGQDGSDRQPVTLRLWDLDTGQDLHRFDAGRGNVKNVAFSPDGRRALAGYEDGTMRLWDVKTGEELQCLRRHQGWVRGVAFLPDGRHAVTAGYDGTVRLWDLERGRELHSFAGHRGSVKGVAVAPDGCHALTAGDDSVVRLWRLPLPDPARKP